jgi:hypothetical protein
MNHYLIVFDRAKRELIRCEPFETRSAALEARFSAEHTFRHNDDIEVVVLGASSPDVLTRTHSRYFKGLRQLIQASLAELPAEGPTDEEPVPAAPSQYQEPPRIPDEITRIARDKGVDPAVYWATFTPEQRDSLARAFAGTLRRRDDGEEQELRRA